MKIIYTEGNTKIIDSYKYDVTLVVKTMLQERMEKNLPITRPFISYVREIKAHNRLYKLGIARSHTKDTDCEENIKKWEETLFRLLALF